MYLCNGVVSALVIMSHLTIQGPSSLKYHETYKELLETELRLDYILNKHINHRTVFIRNMERYLTLILAETCHKTNKESYSGNPVAVLTMLRRLLENWTRLVGMARGLTSDSLTESVRNIRWPSEEDLEAAAEAVATAQLTYGLATELLARGSIDNMENAVSNVTASGGFSVAKAHLKKHNYAEAVPWLQHCLSRISEGDNSAPRQAVLQHLAVALFFLEKLEEYRHILAKMEEECPGTKTTEDLIDTIFNISTKDSSSLIGFANYLKKLDGFGGEVDEKDIELHKKLCQGSRKIDHHLRCRYVHHQQPHLRIQPFKLEELQREPPVLRFYDALTDQETEALRRAAMKIIEPSTVLGVDGAPTKNDFRSSFYAWLFESGLEISGRLKPRMSDMTNLDLTFSEVDQVSSYALSGGYRPHYDFMGIDYRYDRVATLMYYLTDVERGGNTVFLRWKLSVPPVKNSAILWFNFRPDGSFEWDSYHSGCPVLQGKKWVLNKWIRNPGGPLCVGNYTHSYKYHYAE